MEEQPGEQREVTVGVIGLGHWGPHYVRILNQLPCCRVARCCDTDPEKTEQVKKLFPLVDVTDEPEAIYESGELDAVVVATPASTHFEIASRCIESDKDVLLEKPISLTSGEGAALVEAAERAGKVLLVGHTFLYNPGIRKIKELVDRGEVGRVYYLLSTRTHLGLIRDDVNVLWDLAPHDVSIFSFILGGNPVGANAVGKSFLKEGRMDVAFVTLYYPDDVIANINVSWIDSNKERRVSVVGSDKRIVFDDLNNLERVKVFEKGISVEKPVADYGEFQLLLRDGDIISPRIDPSEPLRNMCMHFVDCVRRRTRPLTDGELGLAVVRVMEAIERSLAMKGGYAEIE